MVAAQMPSTPSFAQTTAAQRAPQAVIKNAAIAEAFAKFPKGGDLLSKQIADLIVADPNRAAYLVRYVRTAKEVSYVQKRAAERGLAMALERLGFKAADLPPPPEPEPEPVQVVEYDYTWLILAAALITGGVLGCVFWWCKDGGDPDPVTPN
jgi:hypothetical protein